MNKNIIEPSAFMNSVFERNDRLGEDACQILASAVESVDSYQCVRNQVRFDGNVLQLGSKGIQLNRFERVFLIGFGKASVPMATALLDQFGEKIGKANVITKDPRFLTEQDRYENLSIYLGAHPVPTEASVQSTKELLNDLPELTESDLVLVVISGGGSALFTEPVNSVSIDDLQQLTQSLLKCGATIDEINTLRKHLDLVKGGQLAARLQPASIESVILSDVIGDRLDVIASGPTVEDPTTFSDCLSILEKYQIKDKIPATILKVLLQGQNGEIPETPKPGQLDRVKVDNHLVGTNFIAADAARHHAQLLGYHALIITTHLTGLTEHVSSFIDNIIQTQILYDQPAKKPACLIFGGEPTVNVSGGGLGGRNMDLAIRMITGLDGIKNVLFVSYATDGEDGPTNAAGAVVDGCVLEDGKNVHGLDVQTYIANSDSYHYFERLGGLIKTGATGTNVNDIIILLIGR